MAKNKNNSNNASKNKSSQNARNSVQDNLKTTSAKPQSSERRDGPGGN